MKTKGNKKIVAVNFLFVCVNVSPFGYAFTRTNRLPTDFSARIFAGLFAIFAS